MAEFTSYSQAGQDRFAYEVLGRKTDGTFLDVGAGHVIEKNNSYGLEQIGWGGLCIDLNPQGDMGQRKCVFTARDATEIDWQPLLEIFALWPKIDYLSLDVDGATLDVLRTLPLTKLKFKIITAEHDFYRFGGSLRAEMRAIFSRAGYDLVCGDVHDQGLAFEDWFCDPSVVANAARFRCAGKDWKDILV